MVSSDVPIEGGKAPYTGALASWGDELARRVGETIKLMAIDDVYPDSVWELLELLDERPDLWPDFALAISRQQDRETGLELLDLLLANDYGALSTVLEVLEEHDRVMALYLLATNAYSWADKVLANPERLAPVTARFWLSSHVRQDAETWEWRWHLVERTWQMSPPDAWTVFGSLGIAIPPEPDAPPHGERLWTYVFEAFPGGAFGADPPEPSPEVLRLAEAHAAAFLSVVYRLGVRDESVRSWVSQMGAALPGCGISTCCRPGLFEAQLLRVGHNLRLGPVDFREGV